MRHSILFAATILSLLCCGSAAAQTTIANNVPWNGYDSVQVFQGEFRSIIGSGGQLIAGSANAGRGAVPFSLPAHPALAGFPIHFLLESHTAADLKISPAGWISFNKASDPAGSYIPELRYTTSTVHPFYNKVLMAYWSDLVTEGVPNGGIWWKVDSMPGVDYYGTPVMKRYLAIEWSARRASSISAPAGRFQARIYAAQWFPLNSEIELYYGPESINHPPPTLGNTNLYGAQVGIKNYGQVEGDPALVGEDYDEEKFLIIVHPDSVPGARTRSITRLRTMTVPADQPDADVYQPEWWASYGRYPMDGGSSFRYASQFFHYAFPPIGSGGRLSYRMKPVEVDMGAIMMAMNGLDPSVPNTFEPGTSIQPTLTVANLGGYKLYNVPVKMRIERIAVDGTPQLEGREFNSVIDSLAPSEEILIALYKGKEHYIQGAGYYRITAYVTHPDDRNRRNDTITRNFIIRPQSDIGVQRIILPLSNETPDNVTYQVGDPIPFLARFANTGFNRMAQVRVGYRVTNMNGVLVDSGEETLPVMEPEDSTDRLFSSSWTPSAPGRYFFTAFVITDDDIPQNDTLPGWPGRPFDVRYAVELAAAQPFSRPHAPGINQSYLQGDTIPVEATFINNGGTDATSVPARVWIATENGTVVYDQQATLRMVPSQGEDIHLFPSFTPLLPGRYCATAVITALDDAMRLNDTARWCFTVTPLSGVENGDEENGSSLRLTINPNPARGRTRIDFTTPGQGKVTIGMHDIYSREMMRWEGKAAGGAETIEVDLESLPAGVYMVRLELGNGMVRTEKMVVR